MVVKQVVLKLPPVKPLSLTVRCMAWQEQGVWVAACLDLTLAAQGRTIEQAKARLHQQIAAYVNEAVGIDAQHAEELLQRRAPMREMLRYKFWRAVSNRPRLRRTAAKITKAAGVAMARKLAYIEPIPLHA